MTITRPVGTRYVKMAQRCPKCGLFHSVPAAELVGSRCVNCSSKLGSPASYRLGRNLVTVKDVKRNGLATMLRYEQLYLPLNKVM